MIFTKNKEGVRLIRAKNTSNVWLEKILAHAHLLRGSTQIEHSIQQMAQQA